MYKTSSKQIFSDEFGIYPPAPLKISNTLKHHQNIHVHDINSPYSKWLSFRLFFLMSKKLLNKNSRKKELQRCIIVSGSIGAKINKLIQKNILELNLGNNSLAAKWFLFMGRCFKQGLVFFIIMDRIFNLFKRNKADIYGCIIPLDNTEHIFLKKYNEQKITLGHEHIHLLQYSIQSEIQHPNIAIPRHLFRRHKHFQESLLDKKFKNTLAHIMYLHQPIEIEARLHQFVVDVYLRFHRLPESCNAFLYLFTESEYFYHENLKLLDIKGEKFGAIFQSGYEFLDVVNANEEDYVLGIKASSQRVRNDIILLQKSLKESYFLIFLFKDLCYFYARLVSYYGDYKLANNLITEINDFSNYPLIH